MDEGEAAVEIQLIFVLCSRADDGKQPGIGVLFKPNVAVGEVLVLDVAGVLKLEKALEIVQQAEHHALFVGGDQVAGAAGLDLAGFELDGLKILHVIAFALVFGDEFLDRGIFQIGVPVLDRGKIGLKLRLCAVILAVQLGVFRADELGIILIGQVSVPLILHIFVDRSLVEIPLVPGVVGLKDHAAVDERIDQQHDRRHDHQQGEEGEEDALKQIFSHGIL